MPVEYSPSITSARTIPSLLRCPPERVKIIFRLPRHQIPATDYRAERPSRRGTTSAASSKPHSPQHLCAPASSPNPRLPPNNLTMPSCEDPLASIPRGGATGCRSAPRNGLFSPTKEQGEG